MTVVCGYQGFIAGATQYFMISIATTILLVPLILCENGQNTDSIVNIHPVALHSPIAKLSVKVPSTTETQKGGSVLNRLSGAKSLTSPLSTPVISISNNRPGVSATTFNSSAGKYIIIKNTTHNQGSKLIVPLGC